MKGSYDENSPERQIVIELGEERDEEEVEESPEKLRDRRGGACAEAREREMQSVKSKRR